jgi:hypothetical protein
MQILLNFRFEKGIEHAAAYNNLNIFLQEAALINICFNMVMHFPNQGWETIVN